MRISQSVIQFSYYGHDSLLYALWKDCKRLCNRYRMRHILGSFYFITSMFRLDKSKRLYALKHQFQDGSSVQCPPITPYR